MNSMNAFSKAAQARAAGTKMKVFDWHKAAKIVKDNPNTIVAAGLSGDMDWTGGLIATKGKPVMDSYTYLASIWATPIIVVDDEATPCWVYKDDTKWPESALKLLDTPPT